MARGDAGRTQQLTDMRRAIHARLIASLGATLLASLLWACLPSDPRDQVAVENLSGTAYVIQVGDDSPRLAPPDSRGVAYDHPRSWTTNVLRVMTTDCSVVIEVQRTGPAALVSISRDGDVTIAFEADLSTLGDNSVVDSPYCAG